MLYYTTSMQATPEGRVTMSHPAQLRSAQAGHLASAQ